MIMRNEEASSSLVQYLLHMHCDDEKEDQPLAAIVIIITAAASCGGSRCVERRPLHADQALQLELQQHCSRENIQKL